MLISGSSFFIIIYTSYELLKMVRFCMADPLQISDKPLSRLDIVSGNCEAFVSVIHTYNVTSKYIT